jgi:hypothetical protein
MPQELIGWLPDRLGCKLLNLGRQSALDQTLQRYVV